MCLLKEDLSLDPKTTKVKSFTDYQTWPLYNNYNNNKSTFQTNKKKS